MNEQSQATQADKLSRLCNSDFAKLAKGARVTLVGRFSGRVANLLGQVAVARLFGPKVFGLYSIGWAILRILGILSSLGLDHGVIRYASRYWRTDSSRFKGVLLQSLSGTILSGLLIGGGIYLGAPWLAEQVFKKPDLTLVLRCFAAALSVVAGLKVAASATRVSQQMKYSVYAEELTQPAVHLPLIFLTYLLGWGLQGAVMAAVLSYIIAFILAIFYIKQLFPEVCSRKVKSIAVKGLLSFSLPASFAGIFVMLTIWIDRLIVGYFLPASQVGIYQAASQSSTLFALILTAFNAIFSPMIADLYHRGQIQRLNALFKVGTKWGLYISLPLFLVICISPCHVMSAVFGTEYEAGALSLVILSIAQLINVGTGAVGLLLIMTGHQKRWFLFSALMLFVNIFLNLLLIPKFGLHGAAIGTACAIAGLFLSGLFVVRYSLGLWPYDRRYFKGLLATALTTGVLLLLRSANFSQSISGLSLFSAISIATFGATLYLLGLDPEDHVLINSAKTLG